MAQSKTKRNDFQKGVVVKIKRTQVVADKINPRYISKENAERLKKSIKKNGLVGHLIWNKTTGHIVGGHQRLDALDTLMRTDNYELEVLQVEMPLKDEVRLNVVLNNADAQGEFDFHGLEVLSAEYDLSLSEDFGFSQEVIDINFPEITDDVDSKDYIQPSTPVVASEEDIAHMKEIKKEAREKLKERREEVGDYNTESKGILTIVFDRESAKKQWFIDRGVEDIPNVIHIYEFEKLMKGGVNDDGNSVNDCQ